MINTLAGLINKLFGNKSDRDIKNIQPYVTQTNEWFEQFCSLDIDSLRAKTNEFRSRVLDALKETDHNIVSIEKRIEQSEDVFEKEDLYSEIDSLTEERDEKLEVVLKEILPEAFAVMKRTAQVFMEKDEVHAKATELDKELAVEKDYIEIDGEQVIYQTSWDAAGVEQEWNMMHYDVQLIGGITLHEGKISEMKTGEGKTLVSTLPAYLNALSGRSVHIITVNEYLAQRDADWMRPIYEFLGLTVGCIKSNQNPPERKAAYEADITYGTNNEFGFDYLRDNLSLSLIHI